MQVRNAVCLTAEIPLEGDPRPIVDYGFICGFSPLHENQMIGQTEMPVEMRSEIESLF